MHTHSPLQIRGQRTPRAGSTPSVLGASSALIAPLALAALLAGCSSQDATLVGAPESLLPEPASSRTGTVALAVTPGEVGVSSLRFTIRSADGAIVLDG